MATLTLLDRMRQDLQLRGLAPRTQEAYLDAVTGVAAFCGRPPNALEALTEEDLRQYFLTSSETAAPRRARCSSGARGSASSSRPRSGAPGPSSTSCARPTGARSPSS